MVGLQAVHVNHLSRKDLIPRNILASIDSDKLEKTIDFVLVLEPLWENALGTDWKTIMTRGRIRELYQRMS